MSYNLGFGKINIINGNIAEIIIHQNVEMSLEMVEECENFFSTHFTDSFGLLVNKINRYGYTFEAKLTIGMNKHLKAIAVINYHDDGLLQTGRIMQLRKKDKLNLKVFSGLDLGWQEGLEWLNKELSA